MKILLTGFEPFGGMVLNASWEAVKMVTPPQGIELVRALLPVEYAAVSERVPGLITEHQPDAVIHCGVAPGASSLLIERVALNLCNAASADNAGVRLSETPCVPGGADAYFSMLPIHPMAKRMEEGGVPVVFSYHAGTYLCNHAMYIALHLAHTLGGFCAGFVHVPLFLEQAVTTRQASLPLEVIAKGLELGLCAVQESAAMA